MTYIEMLVWIGRFIFGAYFFYSGINHFTKLSGLAGYAASKKIPYPKAAVILSGVLLLLGGLGVALDVYSVHAAILLLIFLVPTTFAMHPFWSETDPAARMGDEVNFTKNLALIGAALMLLV